MGSAGQTDGAGGVSSDASPRLRVAIVGGGIGGLSLATFLSSLSGNDLAIDIYEAAPSLTELGAGIGMWLRTWRILTSIQFPASDPDNAEAPMKNLAEMLRSIAPDERDMSESVRKAFEWRKGDGGRNGKTFYIMEVPFGVLTLHRADFQRVLAQHAIPPAHPHFGKRIVDYTRSSTSGEITLQFADGSTATCDVLVGADGIRSPIRGTMYRHLAARGLLDLSSQASEVKLDQQGLSIENSVKPDPLADLIEPVWSGTFVYRYLISIAKLEERWPEHRVSKGPVMYLGNSKHIVAYPISHLSNPMINLVAFTSEPEKEGTRISGAWVRSAPNANLLDEFTDWEDEVRVLLELAENPLLWAVHTLKPLPYFADAENRVVLIGDAAHAMTPHQGAGGGQAIEDAHVLAALLAHPRTTKETLHYALQAYEAVRIPGAHAVVKSSRLNGLMYEFNYGWDETLGTESDQGTGNNANDDELVRLHRHGEAMMEIHKWEWVEVEPQEQPKRAVDILEKKLAEVEAEV